MGKIVLEDIIITPLSQINVEGGNVLHALKEQDIGYSGFGEAYFSWINTGSIKAWKQHSRMVLNLVVPVGMVRFGFIDLRKSENPISREFEIGEDNYSRITVPPGIWFGFQGIDTKSSLVLNLSNIQHDKNEVNRLPVKAIEFDWR
jgi:dTDP-4-dehydrorhamnose 3,5-epimerase